MDITLALGGGGAKGNSHIGVIRRLEKEGFRVRGVAGTSFGGLIAVLYALGYSADTIEEYFAALDQTQFYGHAPNDGPSLMGLAGVTRLLEEMIGDATFADLKLRCALTAVDLKSGSEVLLRSGRLVGPLHGIVIALKDQYDTFDMRTTQGADAFFADDRPPDDATFVRRLREAGAIIIAKANMGEYASGDRSSFGGVTCNPYDTERSPGRSSGGSGASVAANLVTCAIREESGGSTVNPASI